MKTTRSSQKQPLVSVIVPAHNERESIAPLFAALIPVLQSVPYRWEVLLVDDGSSDDTAAVAESITSTSQVSIRVVRFSRNFGKEAAITAGLAECTGEAAIMLDADLQHPPSLIPKLLQEWQKGGEVVVGVRAQNTHQTLFKRLGTELFYKMISAMGEIDITPHATDYRLITRNVIDEFNAFSERGRMVRALIDWLGFNRVYVTFEQEDRRHGSASYGYLKLIELAINSFIAYSMFPLRIAGYLGIVITLFSGMLGLFIIVENYLLHDPMGLNFSGPAILGVVTMFLVGVVLMCLGLIALYVATIHREVTARPLYVIRK